MGNWATIDANQLLPSGVVDAVHGMADLANAALSDVKETLADIPSLPSLPTLPSPFAAAVSALLEALETLLTGAKIHVLAIPIVKLPPTPIPPKLPATIVGLQQWLDVELGSSTDTAKAYQRLVSGTGGNAGFYKAFAESFFDTGDQNRPQFFHQNDAVAMAVLMAGASSYSSITHAASMFDQLLRPNGAIGSFNARVTPVPQNVTVKPVPSATGSTIAVRIEWDPPKGSFAFPGFPGLTISTRRYAVIRLVGASSPSVRSVLDVFSTQDLTVGMTNKKGTVVAVGTSKNSSYLDTTAPPTDGTPVYYCVAWETEITEPSETVVDKFDKVSSVTKVMQVAPPPSQTGSPPDWTAFGAAADVFPTLATTMQQVIERAKQLVNGRPSPSSRIVDGLKVAAAMADRLETRAVDLMEDVDRLAASLSRPLPSLYTTRMSSGTGGNAFLMAELSKRLGDLSDPTRPPFDHGEYVCGVCFVAGAPRLADLAAAIAFFDALFGPATPANPLMGILTAIDTAVTAAEETVFDPNMNPLPPGSGGGIDPLTGLPIPPSTPVMSAGGIPIASDDPANPNQGDTNVTPLSDLC